MVPKTQMRESVKRLIERTRDGGASWERDPNPCVPSEVEIGSARSMNRTASVASAALLVHLPRSIIRLHYLEDSGGHECIVISFHLADEKLVARWRVEPDSEDWPLARELLLASDHQLSNDWDVVATDIDNHAIPRDANARQFLDKAAGRWRLTWYFGDNPATEELRIDVNGQYFVEKLSHNPVFTLLNIEYDASQNRVKFEKVFAEGNPFGTPGISDQVEDLQIDADWRTMQGRSTNDGHRLIYERI